MHVICNSPVHKLGQGNIRYIHIHAYVFTESRQMQSPVKVLLQHWFVFQFQSSNFYWRENDSSDSGKLLLLDNHRIYLFQYLLQLFKQQHNYAIYS